MKKWMAGYTALFFTVCLIPFAGMAAGDHSASGENRRLQEMPQLYGEDGFHFNYISELGSYFQDHFGFRSKIVTANALLLDRVFGVSSADNVISGKDGWLYYRDSLNDYLGIDQMSDRGLYNIAHSLAMMQEYVESQGSKFLFTVAPNKNTLYGAHMPYYNSMKVQENGNLSRLPAFLEEEGVSYADLYGLLSAKEEVLYHKRDSHWNNKGAALASGFILDQLGRTAPDWEKEPYEIRRDFEGDLDGMLFPDAVTPEDEIYFERGNTFAYVGEVESNFDPMITTVNPSGSESLVMYRDSFGNAILPFFANEFENAYFSRGVPYQMADMESHQADVVIVERAQRFLPEMAANPPVMQAPLALAGKETKEILNGAREVAVEEYGNYWKISGRIDPEYLDVKSEIYLRFADGSVREAFPVTQEDAFGYKDNGFVAYMGKTEMAALDAPFEILIRTDEEWIKVYQKEKEVKG